MGDALRGSDHLLNGHGDTLGKEKTEPDCGKNDQQGDDGECNEVASLERVLEQFELQVIMGRTAVSFSVMRKVTCAHDRWHQLFLARFAIGQSSGEQLLLIVRRRSGSEVHSQP
jgi:hypothetical protein